MKSKQSSQIGEDLEVKEVGEDTSEYQKEERIVFCV